ncbi:MAG: DEAD/DEAH box helicase [Candidatus Pacebacteria bacterium]|nr:DEAD/DEAH box helicase [Candidatus Paceibacterota bacterium]
MNNTNQQQNSSFYGLGIAPGILEILKKIRYVTPTPIQYQSIPIAIQGKDIVGIAQTGTGKTLAFGIPMIQRLASTKGLGLVLLPTRELALQIDAEIRKVGNYLGLRTAVLIGGVPIGPQIASIRRNPHIIMATPGRLIDHLHQRTVTLKNVNILILDEADRMLDMGFLPQIREILRAVPRERQTMLFSATISPEIMSIASANMKFPIRVEIAPTGTTVESVSQDIFIVAREEKLRLLEKVLAQYSGPTLIFTRTKYGAHRIARAISQMGYSAAEIHSNRTFPQRKIALDGFKSGKYRVLVATDIMARGIDVIGIELVINYDLPSQAEDYVHRIGRTARAGMKGRAISFVTPSEQGEIRAIEWLIRKKLNVSTIPEFPTRQFPKPRLVYSSRKYRRGKLGGSR